MTDESNPSPPLTVVWRWHCCHCMTVLGETAVGTLLRPRPECSGCGERPRLFTLICEGERVVGGRHRATATRTPRRRQSEWMSAVEVHHDSGRLQYVERTFDRRHDRYRERIVDIETGTTSLQKDGLLAEHQGFGAAKRAS